MKVVELKQNKVTKKEDIITTGDLPSMRPLQKGDLKDLIDKIKKRKEKKEE